MKLVALAVVLAASPALADRAVETTIGLTGDMRALGPSYDATANAKATPLGGLRLSFGLEDAPIAMPPPHAIAKDATLVPEVFSGFLADDVHAEGYVGAGLRAEARFANGTLQTRMSLYAAARGLVIGDDHDGATELVIGGYVRLPGGTRVGWEGGAIARPRPHRGPAEARELDAVLTLYVGWGR